MPGITSFPAAGTQDIVANKVLTPGSYRNINLSGASTITFSGPGVYVFQSINITNSSSSFIYDFKNNTNGIIYIYVIGDVFMNKMSVTFPKGGNASRVYMEVHGTGSTSADKATAWNYSPSSTGNGQDQQWFGTVWAPYGAVKVGGTRANVTGALWSGTQVNLSGIVTFNYMALACVTPDVSAGQDIDITCPATTGTLNGSSNTPEPHLVGRH
jgi:hypothetical protein